MMSRAPGTESPQIKEKGLPLTSSPATDKLPPFGQAARSAGRRRGRTTDEETPEVIPTSNTIETLAPISVNTPRRGVLVRHQKNSIVTGRCAPCAVTAAQRAADLRSTSARLSDAGACTPRQQETVVLDVSTPPRLQSVERWPAATTVDEEDETGDIVGSISTAATQPPLCSQPLPSPILPDPLAQPDAPHVRDEAVLADFPTSASTQDGASPTTCSSVVTVVTPAPTVSQKVTAAKSDTPRLRAAPYIDFLAVLYHLARLLECPLLIYDASSYMPVVPAPRAASELLGVATGAVMHVKLVRHALACCAGGVLLLDPNIVRTREEYKELVCLMAEFDIRSHGTSAVP
jgi:hypothetical protein